MLHFACPSVCPLTSRLGVTGQFLGYITSDKRVNQLWLKRAMDKQPCVVYNAAVQYNHTYSHGGLATRLREEAGGKLTAANWQTYQAMWQDIVYMRASDEADARQCSKALAAVASSIP